jgi:uncharacterized damage-inducible protein DinB
MTSLTAEEALRWNDTVANQFRTLLSKHPGALSVACDIRGGSTVADFLQHIVAAELRYAERLNNDPVTDHTDIPKSSVEDLFDTHDFAIAKYRSLLENETYEWNIDMEFATKEGIFVASRRVILFHALLHSLRHYAQLATLLRQAGIATGPSTDYLFMSARRVERRA